MSETIQLVRRHYEAFADPECVDSTLNQALDAVDGPITPASLAAFDQFHVRGLAATEELGALLDLQPGERVLDAGSGLGGPSRYLAQTRGCHVTGVDLAPSYVAIARLLADRGGLSAAAVYQVADLLDLPFEDASFNVAYTQHVMMNIHDRARAYAEIRRVLEPGGRFGFYDVLAVDGAADPIYPTPWSEGPETSAVLAETETRAVLNGAGLAPQVWNDVTGAALAWFGQQRPPSGGGLSLVTVMGPRFPQMAANLAQNLREGRLRLVMGVCSAGAPQA